jgi:UDP-N-acetyl-D-mannosaminuronic acid dehydrogenase
MAFKGDSDDPRASLSYKLRKLANFRGATVRCADPYVKDGDLLPLEEVLRQSDLIVIGAPHKVYLNLDLGDREVVDIWGVTGRGTRL